MTMPDVRKFKEMFIRGLEAIDLIKLHYKSDVDSTPQAQHHTLGPAGFQSSPGDHTHDGRNSRKLREQQPLPVTGSTEGNPALNILLGRLDELGIINNQTTL